MKRRYFKTEPNFLPLLDIIFILLFFFMFSLVITSDFGQVGVKLPQLHGQSVKDEGEKIIITIDRAGLINFNNKIYHEPEALKEALLEKSLGEVYLAADRGLTYDTVLKLIAVIKGGGVGKVNLIFEKE